jgi:AAA domain
VTNAIDALKTKVDSVRPIEKPLRKSVDAGTPGEKSPAHLLDHAFWARDARVTTDLPYLIKGLFDRGQVIVMWGSPGSGKTFACMGLALAVGSGQPWWGRRTRRGSVIYVAAESSRPRIENRIAALRNDWPAARDARVLVVPLALDLLHGVVGDVDRVIATARLPALGDVALIIIDTLSVTFGGGNENGPEDMGLYVTNIKRIVAETGAAVLVVHHAGKDEARGMRGHSALLGALDAELAIEWTPGQPNRFLRTGKVREGEGHADLFAFVLRTVELGVDPDGDPVTTCLVDSLDQTATQRARRERKGAVLGKHQRTVLRLIGAATIGRLPRAELVRKLQDEGVPRNRAHEAIASLLDTGMLVATSTPLGSEVCLP